MSAPRPKPYELLTVAVTVSRRRPGERSPRAERFEVAIERDSTVLHLLYAIRRQFDSTFSFAAHFCKLGNCGACALRVNGDTRLACRVRVTGEALDIQPLPGRKVLCDLLMEASERIGSRPPLAATQDD
ncbi:MAG: hypothetical protein HY521_02880 [Proteobacteria bacterium]|nr:hypothetical protein [Pseudomonadota bacterium]